jgi:antitoxin HigA-1
MTWIMSTIIKSVNMKRRRQPTHPGAILKRLYLQPLKLSSVTFAQAIGVSRKTVSKLLNQRGAVTAEMALRLSIAFNTTPQLWLNLQQGYDLWRVQRRAKGLGRVRRFAA